MDFSFDHMDLYLQCPRRYHYSYIRKLAVPPSLHSIETGCLRKAVFMTFDPNAKQWPEDIGDRYADLFQACSRLVDFWGGESEETVIQRGVDWLGSFVLACAPYLKIQSVNTPLRYPIPSTNVTMLIGSHMESSHKSYTLHFRGPDEPARLVRLHPLMMGLARAGTVRNPQRLCLVFQRSPFGIGLFKVSFAHAERQRVKSLVLNVIKQIDLQRFPKCHPDCWYCAPTVCGYWTHCTGQPKEEVTWRGRWKRVPNAGISSES